jgi:hypothetical protein
MSNDNDDDNNIIDFAETLRESLEAKINEFRRDMRRSYSLKEADVLMIKIQALEWVQGRIQDLVINIEKKEKEKEKSHAAK